MPTPPYSCPNFDEALSGLKEITEELEGIANIISAVTAEIETARSINEQLRAGRDSIENESNEKDEKIEDLEGTISDLNEQISSLERDISSLENELSSFEE
jgi:chromosome segregation ATPase